MFAETPVRPSGLPVTEALTQKWEQEFKKATGGHDTMNLFQFMVASRCKSRYYGVRLFDALDGSNTGYLTFGEYSGLMRLLAIGTTDEVGTFAFNLFDQDKDGVISKSELREALEASVVESDTVMESTEIINFVEVLTNLFADEESQRITKQRFIAVLSEYPDILGNFTVGDHARAAALSNQTTLRILKSKHMPMPSFVENAWEWISDNPKRAFTNILSVLVILACFCWRFTRYTYDCSGADLDYADPFMNVTRREVKDKVEEVFDVHMSDSDAKYMAFSLAMDNHDPIHCHDARKRKLLSWTLAIAKGCGQGMKATFTLILFPVSRTLMTKLRKTCLNYIFDFDNCIAYHRLLGKIGFALAWAHTLLHVVDVVRWQDRDLFKQWSFAFPKNMANSTFDLDAITSDTEIVQGIPKDLLRDPDDQPDVWVLLGSWFGFTGIILIVTYSIAALFAFDYPKKLSIFNKKPGEKEEAMSAYRKVNLKIGKILNNFNYFWYTHHLFAIFYMAILFHPFPHVPDERNEWAWSDTWLWVFIPVGFYLTERINRVFQSSDRTKVVGLRTLPGRVVEVRVEKPPGLKYKAGQYIFVNCWQIAPFEWHPFTLTSAPHDPYLGVHIRAAGDWTSALHKAVREYKNFSDSRTLRGIAVEDATYPFNVRVAGPYGAPAQSYQDYKVIVCIGAGIGVTPFAAVLSDVLHTIRTKSTNKIDKVYFYWTVRSRYEASWFKTLLEEIAANDTEGVLNINIYITSLKEGNDLRVMLLRLAEFESTDKEPGKLVGRTVTRFGRPDWSNIFRNVQRDHHEEEEIGVFFCGPTSLKRVLKAECIKRTKATTPRLVFKKEVF